jgi:hypothetical protein
VDGYWFNTSLFEIEPHEDASSDRQRPGEQLALWLRSQLQQRGHVVTDVIAEDWGWCVVCQSKPFRLWVGCGVADGSDAAPGEGPVPGSPTLWHCFPVAEVPLLARLFGRVDAAPGLRRLDDDLRAILASDSDIRLVEVER